MRKKIDSRIRTLIENNVKKNHRSFFVLIGDRGRDQVVNLHYMLTKAIIKSRPTVLWCYKKELGFSSHKKKRMRQIKKKMAKGSYETNDEDPFELFVSSTSIRYCYYKETHKILGNTFGMLILQDFEAVTPNLLARTIETVEGGGVIILLLKTMSSLKQLYTMTMDVHSRFRTASHSSVQGRFNERFILSLSSCSSCLVVDDELNILPISSHARNITPISVYDHEVENDNSDDDDNDDDDSDDDDEDVKRRKKRKQPKAKGISSVLSQSQIELRELKKSMADNQPMGGLCALTKTLDQAKALLVFMEAISEKTLRSTITLTASRGRGKSAALGLSVAAAIAMGYSNIFVTSPSPENLRTFFEFVFKGFDCIGYKEHLDYQLIERTIEDINANPTGPNNDESIKSKVGNENKCIVRVNVFRSHRQTVQYIHPSDHARLGQAELLVIDEAAAIPLPLVKKLLGPYLIFMASTVHGYEGTGRSLSLKLIQQLRDQSRQSTSTSTSSTSSSTSASITSSKGTITAGGRVLKEVSLEEPIRYSPGDAVESWLNGLLCLDCSSTLPSLARGCPHPSKCELYYINKDTLFSFHAAAEEFLQRVMSLYVASHYKNTPNDLLLISDAPAHHLFVLLGPTDDLPAGSLPDILCVLQVALEGEIAREIVRDSLSRGDKASGDLIPWTIAQQYTDPSFASLSGVRVVRIATHPDYLRMGYASRALSLLSDYFHGQFSDLVDVISTSSNDNDDDMKNNNDNDGNDGSDDDDDHEDGLLKEQIVPRKNLPSLLMQLSERPAERVHYLGTSFGLTQQLFTFWKKGGFIPLYIRQTPNDITGEHSVIMLRPLTAAEEVLSDWVDHYASDFRRRFISLLSFNFRAFSPVLSLDILLSLPYKKSHNQNNNNAISDDDVKDADRRDVDLVNSLLDKSEMDRFFSQYDRKRLDSYADNLVDYHMIMDLMPTLAQLFFLHKFNFSLSPVQSSVLLAIGLQRKSLDDLKELGLPTNQLLAMLNKTIRKMTNYLTNVENEEIEQSLSIPKDDSHTSKMKEVDRDLEDELTDGAKVVTKKLEEKQAKVLSSSAFSQYAIDGNDKDWEDALKSHSGSSTPHMISIKSKRKFDNSSPSSSLSQPSKKAKWQKGGKGKSGKRK